MYDELIDPIAFFAMAMPEAYELGADLPGFFDEDISTCVRLAVSKNAPIEQDGETTLVPLWACLEGFGITHRDLGMSIAEFSSFLDEFVAQEE